MFFRTRPWGSSIPIDVHRDFGTINFYVVFVDLRRCAPGQLHLRINFCIVKLGQARPWGLSIPTHVCHLNMTLKNILCMCIF